MRLCDLDEIKICVDRQYENCHGYSGSKKAIYREAILAVKSILHAAKPIDGVTVQEWISVEDRLPDNKEHDWVLAQVVEDNGYMHIPKVMEYRQAKDDWFEETYGWLSEHNGLFSVTHWMPLPNLPKGEERKDGDCNV